MKKPLFRLSLDTMASPVGSHRNVIHHGKDQRHLTTVYYRWLYFRNKCPCENNPDFINSKMI